MKILLTGGAGYIGSHAAVVLSEAGHEVVVLDNLSNSDAGILDRIAVILNKHLPFIKGDVRDTSLIKTVLDEFKIDAVMHFAGLKSVGESIEDPINYFWNNVQGTISILQAMEEVNVKTLVFSSSATVYGNPEYLPLDEKHPTSVINPYGRNKLHIEEILSDVVATNKEWRVISLRYFNPVGSHDSGLIGEDPRGIPNNLVPIIANVASGAISYLNIYGNDYETPDGTAIRDYIHVMDLAEGHLSALEYILKQEGFHLVNLGTGVGTSVLEMIKAYELANNLKINYQFASRRFGDVAVCFADVEKAKLQLGWEAKRTLSQMCQSSWSWQQAKNNSNFIGGK